MTNKLHLLEQLETYIKSREIYQQKAETADNADKKELYMSIVQDKQRNIDRLKEHISSGKGKGGRRKSGT